MKINIDEWRFYKHPPEQLTKEEFAEVVEYFRELFRLARKPNPKEEREKLVRVLRARLRKQIEEREKLLLAELEEIKKSKKF